MSAAENNKFRRVGQEIERGRWLWAIKKMMDKDPSTSAIFAQLLWQMTSDRISEEIKEDQR